MFRRAICSSFCFRHKNLPPFFLCLYHCQTYTRMWTGEDISPMHQALAFVSCGLMWVWGATRCFLELLTSSIEKKWTKSCVYRWVCEDAVFRINRGRLSFVMCVYHSWWNYRAGPKSCVKSESNLQPEPKSERPKTTFVEAVTWPRVCLVENGMRICFKFISRYNKRSDEDQAEKPSECCSRSVCNPFFFELQ